LSSPSAAVADTWAGTGAQKFAKNGRARITNGDHFLPGVDGRSTWVRRAKDVHSQLVQDRGGVEVVSLAETLIMRRAAVLESELERLELIFAKAGKAEPSELCLYQTCANTQRRLLESIGLERRARTLVPTLEQFTAEIEARNDAATVDAFVESEAKEISPQPAERTSERTVAPGAPSEKGVGAGGGTPVLSTPSVVGEHGTRSTAAGYGNVDRDDISGPRHGDGPSRPEAQVARLLKRGARP
jgi:hypothetical protein